MIQRTLGSVRPELSRTAGTTGMSVTDARFIARLNMVQEELMNEQDWPGVVDQWLFKVDQDSGMIAAPYMFDRVMQITVDDIPKIVVSPYFEFYAYGSGITDDYTAYGRQRRCWVDVAIPKLESPTVKPIPSSDVAAGPWVLRLYCAVDENVLGVPPTINIQGLDNDGLIIRSLSDGTAGDYINGINVDLDFSQPYVETTQEFSKITAVIKPSTNGYIKITAWNGVTEYELSNYAFNETVCSYRHYFVGAVSNRGRSGVRDKVVLARCRRRFVPVAEDNDVLMISNLPALQCGIIAAWKRESGDYEAYQIQKATAVDLLKKEAMAYHGKSRIPSITFQRGYPVGPSPCVR